MRRNRTAEEHNKAPIMKIPLTSGGVLLAAAMAVSSVVFQEVTAQVGRPDPTGRGFRRAAAAAGHP
jgi:hypothetical protein